MIIGCTIVTRGGRTGIVTGIFRKGKVTQIRAQFGTRNRLIYSKEIQRISRE